VAVIAEASTPSVVERLAGARAAVCACAACVAVADDASPVLTTTTSALTGSFVLERPVTCVTDRYAAIALASGVTGARKLVLELSRHSRFNVKVVVEAALTASRAWLSVLFDARRDMLLAASLTVQTESSVHMVACSALAMLAVLTPFGRSTEMWDVCCT